MRNLRACPLEDPAMLVASLPSPASLQASGPRRKTAARARTAVMGRGTPAALRGATAPAWLWLWLIAGAGLIVCVPALRGNALTGATLPFWLVGAPLLDLAWLQRAALARAVVRMRTSRLRAGRVSATRRRG
jgi:hypothetical protein